MAQAKVIIRKKSTTPTHDADKTSPAHDRALRKADMKNMLKSRADHIAGDFQYIKSYAVMALKEIYPSSPWLWCVDKYYPHALGGAVYIDEPGTFEKMELLKPKRDFFNKLGHRYIILKPNGTPFEDEEELNKCGQQPLMQSQI